jgi:hypothetical protein
VEGGIRKYLISLITSHVGFLIKIRIRKPVFPNFPKKSKSMNH